MIKHEKKRWKTEEVAALITMWKKGSPISAIARRLKREENVVRAKVSNLRRLEPRSGRILKHRTVYKNYVLKPEMIPEIRKDKRPLKVIGAEHNVSAVTIWKIKARQMWKGVA